MLPRRVGGSEVTRCAWHYGRTVITRLPFASLPICHTMGFVKSNAAKRLD